MMKQHELPMAGMVERHVSRLQCVFICDHSPGSDRMQRLGKGDVALPRILEGLRSIQYSGPVIASADGHDLLADQMVVEAAEALGLPVDRWDPPDSSNR